MSQFDVLSQEDPPDFQLRGEDDTGLHFVGHAYSRRQGPPDSPTGHQEQAPEGLEKTPWSTQQNLGYSRTERTKFQPSYNMVVWGV